MSGSQSQTLSDFATPSPSQEWPIEVGQHTVTRVTPEREAYGSGDPDTAFHCTNCEKTIRPPEVRSVPDHEWASNRFDIEACEGQSLPEKSAPQSREKRSGAAVGD